MTRTGAKEIWGEQRLLGASSRCPFRASSGGPRADLPGRGGGGGAGASLDLATFESMSTYVSFFPLMVSMASFVHRPLSSCGPNLTDSSLDLDVVVSLSITHARTHAGQRARTHGREVTDIPEGKVLFAKGMFD